MLHKDKALEKFKGPTHKFYEGKASKGIAGESRTEEIKRINEHSKQARVIESSRDRHERRHKGKKGTSKSERLEFIKKMSKDN